MATVFAAVTFTAGGAVALRLYHDNLVSTVETSVHSAARAIAAAVHRGPLPDPIPMPVASGVPRVQVLDAAGRVISGDPASADAPPMTRLAGISLNTVRTVSEPTNLPEHHAAVTALLTTGSSGPLTVEAVGSLDAADAKTSTAIQLSALAGGICLAVIGLVAWVTTGRTLRRVERLRSQVSTITATEDPAGRVPQSGRDELARLGVTLNQMLATLARSAERHKRFAADAAHELRTPIAGLSAAIDLACFHPKTIDQATWTAELAEGHRRLGHLVDDLLELASLDGDAPKLRQPTNLAHIVTDGTRRPAPPGVDLQVGTAQPVVVLGDPRQLARILTNLVDNALRHAQRTVTLHVIGTNGYAVLSVTDDGPGIPVADRQRIFDRFVRLDGHRARPGGGSGLGLALVHDMVAAHAGTVTATGSASGGATFIVRLPLAPTPTTDT
ncbi:MAG: HAMP domain-containing histidine kinase [Acidimicrobiales bacterium]|nr:HAMP domain-containing histidine kinase [Acidimicrobiales bacterium]